MLRWSIIFLTVLSFSTLRASVHSDTLFIISDTTQYDSAVLYHTTFCPTDSFTVKNVLYRINSGDELDLTIINLDTIAHIFDFSNAFTDVNIPAGDTVQVQQLFNQAGTYRYFSKSPQGLWLGAAGVIQVGYSNHTTFIWNLFDMSIPFNNSVARQGVSSKPSTFRPDFCFINGFYYPQTAQDEDALVTGSVGDTIVISIVNNGLMTHSLHFHGYHVDILETSINNYMTGWSKDSFPVVSGEMMTVQLVPHQPGMYPVHDHNLISVTNAGYYPGGMITQLHITP